MDRNQIAGGVRLFFHAPHSSDSSARALHAPLSQGRRKPRSSPRPSPASCGKRLHRGAGSCGGRASRPFGVLAACAGRFERRAFPDLLLGLLASFLALAPMSGAHAQVHSVYTYTGNSLTFVQKVGTVICPATFGNITATVNWYSGSASSPPHGDALCVVNGGNLDPVPTIGINNFNVDASGKVILTNISCSHNDPTQYYQSIVAHIGSSGAAIGDLVTATAKTGRCEYNNSTPGVWKGQISASAKMLGEASTCPSCNVGNPIRAVSDRAESMGDSRIG
jgi:hypothetical protein